MIKTVIISSDDSSITGKEQIDCVDWVKDEMAVDGSTRGGIMHLCSGNYYTKIDEIKKLMKE